MKLRLIYMGCDFWSRPVFKQENKERYFGSLHILFSPTVTIEEVKEKLRPEDICYFGTTPDGDPLGSLLDPDKLELVYIKE